MPRLRFNCSDNEQYAGCLVMEIQSKTDDTRANQIFELRLVNNES